MLETRQEHFSMVQPDSISRVTAFLRSYLTFLQISSTSSFLWSLPDPDLAIKLQTCFVILMSLKNPSLPWRHFTDNIPSLAWDLSFFSMVWDTLSAWACLTGRTVIVGYNCRARQVAELFWMCGRSYPHSAVQPINSWRTHQGLHLSLREGVWRGCRTASV